MVGGACACEHARTILYSIAHTKLCLASLAQRKVCCQSLGSWVGCRGKKKGSCLLPRVISFTQAHTTSSCVCVRVRAYVHGACVREHARMSSLTLYIQGCALTLAHAHASIIHKAQRNVDFFLKNST